MKVYSAIEKQQIMILSDLLNSPLTIEEVIEVQKSNLDIDKLIDKESIESSSISEELKNKIINLLGQGMKLGIELDKLAKRGIEINFLENCRTFDFVYKGFEIRPKFLFTIGNSELFSKNSAKLVFKYSDFKKNETYKDKDVIFIADRKLDLLLRYEDITNKLINKSLILISNSYRTKSNLEVRSEANITQSKSEANITQSKSKANITQSKSKGKVFISGSRSQREIPQNVQHSLKLIMKNNIDVLIGDSDKGVDKEIIDYFRGTYNQLEIFSIKSKPRVEIEKEWKQRLVNPPKSLKPQEQQMFKDRIMADEADWGLAVFNPFTKNRYGTIQISSGTLRNTIQLLLNNKSVKFFYLFENEITVSNLKTIEDLEKVIMQYKNENVPKNEAAQIKSVNSLNNNSNIAELKYEKIYLKFKELLKSERKIIDEKYKIANSIDGSVQQTLFDIYYKEN